MLDIFLAWIAATLFLFLIVAAGAAVAPTRWLRLPTPWPAVIAFLLGWQLVSILVFVASLAHLISSTGLVTTVVAPLILLTALSWKTEKLHQALRFSPITDLTKCDLFYKALIAISGVFMLITGLIASAPPTKHDDIQYHLLVGHRALQEGAFVIHPSPFLTTPPHMVYEAIYTVLLALAPATSVDVFSYLISLLFVILVFERTKQISLQRAILMSTMLVVALANAVWWVSASAAPASALFGAFLVLWLFEENEFRELKKILPLDSVIVTSLLASALCMTKLPFLAPAGLAIAIAIWRQAFNPKCVLAATTVLVLTYGPWVAASYAYTGSPLGFSTALGSRIFDKSHTETVVSEMRSMNQADMAAVLAQSNADCNTKRPITPLTPLWGVLLWLKETLWFRQVNLLHPLVAFGLGTATLIYLRRWDMLIWMYGSAYLLGLLVHHDLRYHSVELYGLPLIAGIYSPSRFYPEKLRKLAPAILAVVSLPCLAGLLWYSTVFLPVVLGFQSKDEFLLQHTAVYNVWQWANVNTPKNSRFCIMLSGLPRLFYLERFALQPEQMTKTEVSERFSLVKYMSENQLNFVVTKRELVDLNFTLVKRFDKVNLEAWRQPKQPPIVGTVYIYKFDDAGQAKSDTTTDI